MLRFFYLSLAMILLWPVTSNAQQPSTQYVQVRFAQQWDRTIRKPFYILIAEAGCDSSAGFYTMRQYNIYDPEQNKGGVKFKDTKQTGSHVFNYFTTISEGLNYMAALGWNMVFAYTEIRNDQERSLYRDVIYPSDNDYRGSPRPIFCFKKEQ